MQEENKIMNDKGSLGPQAESKIPISVIYSFISILTLISSLFKRLGRLVRAGLVNRTGIDKISQDWFSSTGQFTLI